MPEQSTPQRRNLLAELEDEDRAPIPPAALAPTAAKFAPQRPIAPPAPVEEGIVLRERQLVRRDTPFSTRLRLETKNEINRIANDRNIPVAQVIEEALAALREAKA